MRHSTPPRRHLAAASISAAVLACAGQAQAGVVFVQDAAKNLTGISGLTVAGQNYDVSFQDGKCSDLFTGCSTNTNSFLFSNQLAAIGASTALLEMLSEGVPGAINGCNTAACLIVTPYVANFGQIYATGVNFDAFSAGGNYLTDGFKSNVSSALYLSAGADTSSDVKTTFAVWSAASTAAAPDANNVPEPGSLALAAVGLGAAFMARGKSRRRVVTKA